MRSMLGLLAIAGWAVMVPATANPLKSLYTTIELSTCEPVKSETAGSAWLCPGLEDQPVYISVRGQRTFVSVGIKPELRKAATQSLGVSNSLFRGPSQRATLEWRIVRRNGQPIPFATIQKFFTGSSALGGEVLVVTKVTETEDCHVAYIDALANAQPIVEARLIADKEARAFDCSKGPRVAGKRGRSPM